MGTILLQKMSLHTFKSVFFSKTNPVIFVLLKYKIENGSINTFQTPSWVTIFKTLD